MPVLGILGTFGYMFGAGGSAIIARTLGEQNRELANRMFALFVMMSAVLGLVMQVFGYVFLQDILASLGAGGVCRTDGGTDRQHLSCGTAQEIS